MKNPARLFASIFLSATILIPQIFRTGAQDCEMSMWVFDTLDRCNRTDPPNAVGTIYADGQCRTVETDASSGTPDYALFPGNYRAECTSDGKLSLTESGCIDSICSVTSLDSDAVCDRDNSQIAALYSRLEPPIFALQSPALATPGALYTCLRLLGNGINVTFVVFGDCSNPGCAVVGEPRPPVAPPPPPTPAPVAPVPAPTDFPTTEAPVESPVTDPPTDEPTFDPTPAPAETPTTKEPTAEPTGTPTSAPLAEGAPTRTPSTSEPTVLAPPSPDNGNVISDKIVGVGLRYFPMFSTLPPGANDETGLSLWEFATTKQIRDQSEASGITVMNITLSNVSQKLLPSNSTPSNRMLQQDEEQLLEILFDLEMMYSRADPPPPTLDTIFTNAFDTEADRNNYLLKLTRADDPDFEELLVISIASNGEDEQPAPVGNTGGGSGGGSNAPIIAGAIVGVVVASVIAGFFVFRHRKKTKDINQPSSLDFKSRTKEETPISNNGHNNQESYQSAAPQQRWTNEIVVDQSADDVSTLGGSVLAGLNLMEGGNNQGEDEPTASVNLDYDYDRQQYRSDVEDIRSRSQMESTACTNYSKLGLLGDSVFADDMSFEQQFADEDDEPMTDTDDIINNSKNNKRPKPFEVRAPPGMLGMVIDTPNGGVPVVRAIKPDSILTGRVQIGDRLITVDQVDVTSMTALEVSNLISVKSSGQRLLVFVRLTNGKV